MKPFNPKPTEECARPGCEKRFSKTRKDRIYCSDRCKYLMWQEYGANKAGAVCYYCGNPAHSLDISPPYSVRRILEVEVPAQARPLFTSVKACEECCRWLEACPDWDIAQRKLFVKHCLWKHYSYVFDDAEFAEATGFVDAAGRPCPQKIMRAVVQRRLNY